MFFEAELTFEGVEDRLYPLPDPSDLAEPAGFVLAVRTDQVRAEVVGDERFEVFAGEALVSDDDLVGVDQVVVAFEERLGDFAFADLGVGEAPDDGHSVGGADQVEPESPKVSRAGGAVSVASMAGQFGDHRGEQPGCLADPFTPPGLLRQVGEHVFELLIGVADPLAERNGHRKDDGVALLDQLLVIAGLDRETIAKQIASLDGIGVLVAQNYLMHMPKIDLAALIDTTALQSALRAELPDRDIQLELMRAALGSMSSVLGQLPTAKTLEGPATTTWAENLNAALSAQMKAIDWTQLARSTAALDGTRTAPGDAEA